MLQFTHLLKEAKSKYSPNIKPYLKTHDILDSVDGFSHIVLNYNMLPPIRIKTRPIIFIMKRKSNIRYDPKKAKPRVSPKPPLQGETRTSTENKDAVNDTVERMEPILDEIMESLEEFEKPLNISNEIILDVKEEEEIVTPSDTQDSSSEYNETLNVEQVSTNLSETNLSHLETSVEEEKLPNMSEVENGNMTENHTELQHSVDNNFTVAESKLNTNNEESEKVGTLKGKLEVSNVLQEGSSIKETVKKMIQVKLEAVKLKRETTDEKKVLEDPEKNNARPKRIVPIKVELPQKIKAIPKQELKEKPMTIQETAKDRKAVNVKESIRNIINQFKEFEKDFVHEDLELIKKEPRNEHSEQSVEMNTKTSTNSVNEVDATANGESSRTIKDARESLRDIINQFKQIKSELTSEEEDPFEQIEATYMQKPISETLMQFSEALKNLIQRRNKSKTFIANNLDNKKVTSKLHLQPKEVIDNSQSSSELLKTVKVQNYEKEEKTYDMEKLVRDTETVNVKESANLNINQASQEKHFTEYRSNRDVPSIAQKSTDNVSNNIEESYTSEEDNVFVQKK